MAEPPIKSPPRKTTRRSSSTKTKNAKSEPPKKRTKSVAPKRPMITVEERYRLIAESAYYRAHDRHFEGGDSLRDWLDAENEIDSHYETVNPR